MFTDPQSVTIDGVAQSMPRVSTGLSDATYRTADETHQLRISHQASKGRKRRMVRLDKTVIAADPLSAENASQKLGVYLVIDEPIFGFTDSDIDKVIDGFVAWWTTGNITKVLGGES